MLVQGSGAVAVLVATLWLGASLGPESQGQFSRTKAEIEFIAAFSMFGLPQALFYFVKSNRMSGRAAVRWAAASAALATAVGLAYAITQRGLHGAMPWLGLAVAIGVCVWHGQLRALLLVAQRTEWFNAVTAWPQWVLLAGVLVVVARGAGDIGSAWAWLFAVAFGSSAALAQWRLRVSAIDSRPGGDVAWRELARFGLANWLTAALSTAAVLLMQRWVEAEQGAADLGRFTMALMLAQVPLTPIGYAAPLLLRRWMERPGSHAAQRWAAVVFVALALAAAAAWVVAPLWPDLGLGAAYPDLSRALAVLLVGAAAEASSRLLAANALARGTPWIAVRAEGVRWAVLILAWGLSMPDSLLEMCALWSVAALSAAVVFVWHARVSTAQPGNAE